MPAADAEKAPGGRAPTISVLVALVVLVAFVAFLLLSGVLDRDPEAETVGESAGLSSETYRDIVLGIDPEALRERLLPVEPVDRVPPRSPDDEPLPAAQTRCLYYEASESAALYRFCFTDDRLIDKKVVEPPPSG